MGQTAQMCREVPKVSLLHKYTQNYLLLRQTVYWDTLIKLKAQLIKVRNRPGLYKLGPCLLYCVVKVCVTFYAYLANVNSCWRNLNSKWACTFVNRRFFKESAQQSRSFGARVDGYPRVCLIRLYSRIPQKS